MPLSQSIFIQTGRLMAYFVEQNHKAIILCFWIKDRVSTFVSAGQKIDF